MLLSSMRTRRERVDTRRPTSVRPRIESLDPRIVPANPHFVGTVSSTVIASGAVAVSFREAGLGNNQNIDYSLTGDVDATFGFVNKGGNVVHGAPWLVTDTTLATGTIKSDQNGTIAATLTSDAPTPDLKKPNGKGWTLVFDISYRHMVLTDTTNGVSTDVPDASANTFPA